MTPLKQMSRYLSQVNYLFLGRLHNSEALLRPTSYTFNSRNFCASSNKEKGDEKVNHHLESKDVVPLESDKDKLRIELVPEVEARMEFKRQHAKFRKEVISLEETEIEGYAIGVKNDLTLREIREGKNPAADSFLSMFGNKENGNHVDKMAFMKQDIDLRSASIKRWWARLGEKEEIRLQMFNPQRNSVLGDDLAAAHFVVFRKGRVKFMGLDEWVTEYRVDAVKGLEEEDLPGMQFNLCTLPTTYDPRYLVEAIDASNIPLRYEGLENFANLHYCKSLKLENCKHIEAWCIDKLAYMFEDRLEYLDLSGCTGLTEGAVCALVRFKKLKTLVVKNLPQLTNLPVICAILEDSNPNLTIIGVDYESKLREIEEENERLNKQALELEASTIDVDPKSDTNPSSEKMQTKQ